MGVEAGEGETEELLLLSQSAPYPPTPIIRLFLHQCCLKCVLQLCHEKNFAQNLSNCQRTVNVINGCCVGVSTGDNGCWL